MTKKEFKERLVNKIRAVKEEKQRQARFCHESQQYNQEGDYQSQVATLSEVLCMIESIG